MFSHESLLNDAEALERGMRFQSLVIESAVCAMTPELDTPIPLEAVVLGAINELGITNETQHFLSEAELAQVGRRVIRANFDIKIAEIYNKELQQGAHERIRMAQQRTLAFVLEHENSLVEVQTDGSNESRQYIINKDPLAHRTTYRKASGFLLPDLGNGAIVELAKRPGSEEAKWRLNLRHLVSVGSGLQIAISR